MGVDVTLFLGRLTNQAGFKPEEGHWFQIHAMVDLDWEGRGLLDQATARGQLTYIYPPAGDGDTPVLEDKYASRLVAQPIGELISWLEREITTDERREHFLRLRMLRALVGGLKLNYTSHFVVYAT